MRVYLDNNATTRIHPDVLQRLEESLRDVFGNASSIHQEGQTARRAIEDARESVARLIGAEAREVVFTSGGTESNNAAIFGVLGREGRHHIVTTAIEHPSVAEALAAVGRSGNDITVVRPGRDGAVTAEAVSAALRDDTRLVAVMLANNETGVIQPVAEIGRICRARGIHLHCDAVQAAGKIEIDVGELMVDTLALAGHKFHAPKGIGALYVRRGLTLEPYLHGGAQERRRRAGTENVPLAAAFGVAAALAMEPGFKKDLKGRRDRFESALRGEVTINGAAAPRLPNTSNVIFHDADAEGIAIALDLEGIAVSTGSACASGRVEPSRILLAMGLTPEQARSSVRFSLSRFTTDEEIDRVLEVLARILPRCTKSVEPTLDR